MHSISVNLVPVRTLCAIRLPPLQPIKWKGCLTSLKSIHSSPSPATRLDQVFMLIMTLAPLGGRRGTSPEHDLLPASAGPRASRQALHLQFPPPGQLHSGPFWLDKSSFSLRSSRSETSLEGAFPKRLTCRGSCPGPGTLDYFYQRLQSRLAAAYLSASHPARDQCPWVWPRAGMVGTDWLLDG